MADFNPEDPNGRHLNSSSDPLVMSFGSSDSLNPSSMHQVSSASSYADLQYLFGDQETATMIVPKPNRNRRKPTSGSEHTKHRRTRSGCYTCRSRRVKCDETHPICERCQKGGRECVYPETPASKSSAGPSSKRPSVAKQGSPGSSSDESGDGSPRLEVIRDEYEEFDHPIRKQSISTLGGQVNQPIGGQDVHVRQGSETPSLIQDKAASPTPSTEGSVGYSTYPTAESARSRQAQRSPSIRSDGKMDWSHLPSDIQYYLQYFCENVTHLHYSLKFDSEDFLHTRFLDYALQNESLLYAIVGFSAFQRTLRNPAGRIQDFLQYYNKAVSLLLQSLKKGERHGNGTILAILQLATIEEFLGDWINLLGHQKAALEILTELYSPQTVMEDEKSRIILGWYMRFDLFAGLMGGFETVLSRQWFSYAQDYFQHRVQKEPDKLNWKIEFAIAQNRLIGADMSLLFAKAGKGEIPPELFFKENEELSRRIQAWFSEMDPALNDPRYLVTDFTGARPLEPDDIVDPYLPNVIFTGPLFVMNVLKIDWLSIDLMHRFQTALSMKQQPSPEVGKMAYATCQLFEAVEYYPNSPPGAVLGCQASLGMASLFLPKDQRHSMWARRKFATVESHGYIYPYTFRSKMADLFGDRSCMNWWLPNDERYPPIVRSIRRLIEERTSPANSNQTEDLKNIKAIFANMGLEDGKTSVTAGAIPAKLIQGVDGAISGDGVHPFGYENEFGSWDQVPKGRGYGTEDPSGFP